MKTFLMVLGGIFGAIILLIIGVIAFFIFSGEGKELDAESKAWVDEVIPSIVTVWDREQLVAHSSSLLLDTTDDDGINNLFDLLNEQFGPLVEYRGSEGQAIIRIRNTTKTITAKYEAFAEFEKGEARITVHGLKEEDGWRLLEFYVAPIRSGPTS